MDKRSVILASGVAVGVLFVVSAALYRAEVATLVLERLDAPEVASVVAHSADFEVKVGNYYFNVDNSGAYDLERAEKHFQRALELDPQVADAWHQLARISFLRGEFDEALNRINEQLDTHGDELMAAYYIRGLIYGFAGNFEQAEADFKTFLEWDPQNWAAWNDLAWVYFTQGKFEEMEAAAQEGLAVDPQSPWLLLMRGVALINLGEREEAVKSLQEAKRHASRVTPFVWGKAYPGNDPRVAESGLAQMRAAIERNIDIVHNSSGE